MQRVNGDFRDRVLAVVAQIPEGRVMTYGQLAALCGSPRSALVVGGIAHWSDQTLPWQRVVHKDGALATGFPGGVEGHRIMLEAEGVKVNQDYKVDVGHLLWLPKS
ncbi:MAG TPA: MGMT family protein [Candidatus Saccharimonadales bacterium]|nr:MGMT family protein [Candidatus Saccharimonadales bacterium]